MSVEDQRPEPHPDQAYLFTTTHWSVVLAAGKGSSPEAHAALQELCGTYRPPLYGFVRRNGYSPENSEDLVHGFFERLLERDLLADLKPTGGRFRSFLLHALKNHLASEWTRSHAAKRGGTQSVLSLDELSAEERDVHEPVEAESPDIVFERRWARTVLSKALDRLRQEQAAAGKEVWFNALVPTLTGSDVGQTGAELATQLGVSEAAVKMALHRLRRRYGELLRLEVAKTVLTPGEIDQELRYLLQVLAGRAS